MVAGGRRASCKKFGPPLSVGNRVRAVRTLLRRPGPGLHFLRPAHRFLLKPLHLLWILMAVHLLFTS